MAVFRAYLLPIVLVVLMLVSISEAVSPIYGTDSLNRSIFPVSFIFGASSSAYQYEGAADEGGRGPSIWDTFTHKYPGKIKDRSNGDVAVDEYHHYKEDVRIIEEMNLDAYRFSISWSRILPKGKLLGGVNKEGINYYNNVINELLAKGVQPFVTIFHWDVPQTLEDEYGGFLSPKIVKDYGDFAEVCFKEFGEKVKHWITLNEPWIFSRSGYGEGQSAPGRCSAWQNGNCSAGDSATEPYTVAHHLLLAHAAAVNIYKTKYQTSQRGLIGITHACQWMVPFSNTIFDHYATQRALDFMFGWFMDPLTTGDYPASMRSLVGKRLPKFSKRESKMLIGSFDFIGLNYYTATYAADAPLSSNARPSYLTDSRANLSTERDGIPIGSQTNSSWNPVYPKGLQDLLLYIKTKYNNPLVYITENGYGEFIDPKLSLEEVLFDGYRVYYHYQHLYYLLRAIKDGANVKGYFAWTLLDDFEWDSGYTLRFGLNFVDHKNGFKRYPKLSSLWFKNFLKKH